MRTPWIGIIGLAAVCALSHGCRKNTVPETLPVKGTVKLDGKPVEGADVAFYPKSGGRPAMGRTDANGSYTLSTFGNQDGAVPGEHSVVISKVSVRRTAAPTGGGELEGMQFAPSISPEAEKARTEYLIPEKYSMASRSGLTAEVKPDCGPIDFDLKR
ncbi:MAG: carboxypeptidase-like regulatory domain-containing protein [Thermoguttaceae bacterium]|jgi:hypothetical protein